MSKPPITISTLRAMKRRGEKIAVLTAYDASFARLLEAAGIEVLLVGDSLGMVIQGCESTLPVDVDDVVYHTRSVARVRQRALLMADMPFLSYGNRAQALNTAGRLMKEGGAQMVKLEGGASQIDTVRHLNDFGIPVCAHLGLMPQSVYKLGGYKVQGRDHAAAQAMREDALALQEAGASMLVLECIPATLAKEISASLAIPVIGIGAGPDCDGQVLVLYDMLGITGTKAPRFVKDFLTEANSVEQAVAAYVSAVKNSSYPTAEYCY